MIGYFIFSATVALGTMCIAYDGVARAKGWPVGSILSNAASIPKLAALVSVLWALGKSLWLFSWWSPIVIWLAGTFVAFVAMFLLKRHAQTPAIIGPFVCLFLTAGYVSEDTPLGALHRLFS